MKKGARVKKYRPEYRRGYVPPPLPEAAACTRLEKCVDCPYPGSGFICWSESGDCMRTRMEKLQNKKGEKQVKFLSRAQVKCIRQQYPPGTEVELLAMLENPHPVSPGTRGKVIMVDDVGKFVMKWSNGSCLSLIPGVD